MPLTLLIGTGLLALGAVRLSAAIAAGRLRLDAPPAALADTDLPPLLLQIPVFNEPDVIAETLRVVRAMDYPAGRLTIQILDDSKDETSKIIADFLLSSSASPHRWQHLQRSDRSGWKAGALAAGLADSPEEFVAILDADFRPEPGWLKRMMAELLARTDAAFVQSAWAFETSSGIPPENEGTSSRSGTGVHKQRHHDDLRVLGSNHTYSGTSSAERPSYSFSAQNSSLSFYFNCIQSTCSYINLPFHFNGTAGIWRVQAIRAAGGWLSRTIVEDMDLSYRALLQSQRGYHIPGTAVASQLPVTLSALLTQQRRWALGAGQCARQHLGAVLRAPRPVRWRVAGVLGLLSGLGWVLLLAHLLLLPLAANLTPIHLLPATLACVFFALSQFIHERRTAPSLPSLLRTANALSLAIRICPQTAAAAIAGWLGAATEFTRTPKGERSQALRSFALPNFLHLIVAAWLATSFIFPATPANPFLFLPTIFSILSLLRAA